MYIYNVDINFIHSAGTVIFQPLLTLLLVGVDCHV